VTKSRKRLEKLAALDLIDNEGGSDGTAWTSKARLSSFRVYLDRSLQPNVGLRIDHLKPATARLRALSRAH
jgi:hypothetical protein